MQTQRWNTHTQETMYQDPERKSRDGATDQAPTLQTFSVGIYAYRYLDLTVFKSSF